MLDTQGRSIEYLRISVTDRCNLRCRYCMPEEGIPKVAHQGICSLERLWEIARAAAACGVWKIRLTGGEPLVRKGIVDFCRMLSSIEGIRELCMTTNATLLPALARPLKEAGVTRLNVSLDTLNQEKFRQVTRCGQLRDVLDGLRAAEDAGFTHLKLNCVLCGGFNDGEIPDFVELTRDRDWEVRFIELMPMGPCAGWDRSCFLPADTVLDRCPSLRPVTPEGVARRYQIPGYRGTVGLIEPMSHAFCQQCNRIRLTADGKLKPCLHSSEELSLEGLHGDALEEAVRTAILHKPERHRMSAVHASDTPRTMNQIGG